MLKRHSFSFLIATLFSATTLAAVASPAKLMVDSAFLSGPGAKYDALAQLKVGALVDIIWCGTTENWCLVQIHNKKGWVPLATLNLKVGRKSSAADSGTGDGSSGGSAFSGVSGSANSGSSGGAAGQFSQVGGGFTVTQSSPSLGGASSEMATKQ